MREVNVLLCGLNFSQSFGEPEIYSKVFNHCETVVSCEDGVAGKLEGQGGGGGSFFKGHLKYCTCSHYHQRCSLILSNNKSVC